MSQSGEGGEKKTDVANIPRGAISLKGVPVNRNARLPSIRSPRDLTLGTPAKRTFLPNIPARRQKKTDPNENKAAASSQLSSNTNNSDTSKSAESNRRKQRKKQDKKANIIQTEGSVFADGLGPGSSAGRFKGSAPSSKGYGASGKGSGKGSLAIKMKLEKIKADINIDLLMRDDFIDDGDDEETGPLPTFFPLEMNKREVKVKDEKPKSIEQFDNQNFAKEMGFDVQKIAKFIKKEKDDHVMHVDLSPDLPKNEITELLASEKPQLVLFQLPKSITAPVPESKEREQVNGDATSKQKSSTSTSLASLPEGRLGKLQIMKSGRIRLKIEDLYYDLDCASKLSSKHDVVSIQTNGATGDIAMLGNLLQSFSFVPDVDSLLK